jgi:lysophospholipase L1-like esterase
MDETVQLTIGFAEPVRPGGALQRTIRDVCGTYTIPYIQSRSDLRVEALFVAASDIERMDLTLRNGVEVAADASVTPASPVVEFTSLAPAEYSLRVDCLDASGAVLTGGLVRQIGIGTVIAALGDSITEGYHGYTFMREDLNLRGSHFPCSAVSRDGRNFPQFAPTASVHKPEANCFQSWMTDLNDKLTVAWDHPVFIANEGWGGYTAADYLRLMDTDDWQRRMKDLEPVIWLLHLGVNDERAKRTADLFEEDMNRIAERLIVEYGAEADTIYIAKPCYDYWPGASRRLAEYSEAIERIVRRLGLRQGPDFFTAYASNHEKWYGKDPVHPTVLGMRRMASLWADSLTA